MDTAPAVSDELLHALSSLDGLEGVVPVGGWGWVEAVQSWSLRVRVSRNAPSTRFVPSVSDWYFLAEDIFPWGSVACLPAKDGGVSHTFPHQTHNGPGAAAYPWRDGNVCLETWVHSLGRHGAASQEMVGSPDRLAWRAARLQEWLRRAARGELLLPGDPFELPDYRPKPAVVAFCEDEATYGVWCRHLDVQSGIVELGWGSRNGQWLFAQRFCNERNRSILRPAWGSHLGRAKANLTGIWLRLDEVPVLRPWQAPATWGELRQACQSQGLDLDGLLFPCLRHVRKADPALLLIGFPIPALVGGQAERMHWLPLHLHDISRRPANGWRHNEDGFLRNDRIGPLSDGRPLQWMESQNWHRDQVGTRGKLPEPFASQPVLVIGAGALGSAVCELLVRAGTGDVAVADGEKVEAGNLVRHVADLAAVNRPKAHDLALRLNAAMPQARVRGIDRRFPRFSAEDLELSKRCRTAVDTTAEDDVIERMGRFDWDAETLLVSVSLGRLARRLFCYAARSEDFSHASFRSLIAPWLDLESQEASVEGDDPVWSGIGCWHPVFPARVDDVRLLATVAVKELARLASSPPGQPSLMVWEQCYEDGEFAGIRRARLLDEHGGHDA